MLLAGGSGLGKINVLLNITWYWWKRFICQGSIQSEISVSLIKCEEAGQNHFNEIN